MLVSGWVQETSCGELRTHLCPDVIEPDLPVLTKEKQEKVKKRMVLDTETRLQHKRSIPTHKEDPSCGALGARHPRTSGH